MDLLCDFLKAALRQQDNMNGKVLCAYVDRIIKKHSELLHAEPDAMKGFINEFNNTQGEGRDSEKEGTRNKSSYE